MAFLKYDDGVILHLGGIFWTGSLVVPLPQSLSWCQRIQRMGNRKSNLPLLFSKWKEGSSNGSGLEFLHPTKVGYFD